MLKFKGALDNYSLNPIEGLSEKDVADAFKKSKFFLVLVIKRVLVGLLQKLWLVVM